MMPDGVDSDFNVFRGTEEDFAAFCDSTRVGPPEEVDQTVPPSVMLQEARDLIVEDLIEEYRKDRANRVF